MQYPQKWKATALSAARICAATATLTLLSACGSTADKPQVTSAAQPYILNAIKDFKNRELSGHAPAYVDQKTQALAIDAAQYKDVLAAASTTFNGESGTYTVNLTALTELDGESRYVLKVGDKAYAEMQNPESELLYSVAMHRWENVQINKGDTIEVHFSAETNGKIPEGDGTAWSRGRWTQSSLLCTKDCN